MNQEIFLIGFGSQGTAWAQSLRASGWQVRVVLHRQGGASFERARELGFSVEPLTGLATALLARPDPRSPAVIALLCPDHAIGHLYREFLASLELPLLLCLAHGYAVYARELTLARPSHELALVAPKAIGPKLLAAFEQARPRPHRLVAGFAPPASAEGSRLALAIARGLGFDEKNLVRATFEQEAVGDLISEQGLLCGSLFTFLDWTIEAMREARIPEELIREECLTELELIAGLLRERGPAATFAAISPAAQCGTTAMRDRLLGSGAKAAFDAQISDVISRKFIETMRSPSWIDKAKELKQRLSRWEKEKP